MKKLQLMAVLLTVAFCLLLLGAQFRVDAAHCLSWKFFAWMFCTIVIGGGGLSGALGTKEHWFKIFLWIIGISIGEVLVLALWTKVFWIIDPDRLIPFLGVRILLCAIAQYVGWILTAWGEIREIKNQKERKAAKLAKTKNA